eukprot:3394247-Amphidinium_carterae.1
MDCFEVTPPELPPQAYIVVTCFGTRLIATYHNGATSSMSASIQALSTWISHFGVPQIVQTDNGPEYGANFSRFVEESGARHVVTDPYAPHQNGKVERQVGLVKGQLALAFESGAVVQSVTELNYLLAQVANARNSFIDRSGHSSSQRVFGHSPRRWFHELLSEDNLDTDSLALDGHESYARQRELRQAALSSLIQLDSRTRLQRASRARSRTTESVQTGDWVYVLRQNRLGRKWREGPAIIVQVSGASVWLSLRGHLYKCALLNVRKATKEEVQTVHSMQDSLQDLTPSVEHRGRRKYTDISHELPWDEDDNTETTIRSQPRRDSSVTSTGLPHSATMSYCVPSACVAQS